MDIWKPFRFMFLVSSFYAIAGTAISGPLCGQTPCIDSHDVIDGQIQGIDLALPLTMHSNTGAASLTLQNESGAGIDAAGGTFGLRGESANGIGVRGFSRRHDGAGVEGSSTGATAKGVWAGNSSSGFGVWGQSKSGTAIYGIHTDSGNYGAIGRKHSSVLGIHKTSRRWGALGTSEAGVVGYDPANNGYAGRFVGKVVVTDVVEANKGIKFPDGSVQTNAAAKPQLTSVFKDFLLGKQTSEMVSGTSQYLYGAEAICPAGFDVISGGWEQTGRKEEYSAKVHAYFTKPISERGRSGWKVGLMNNGNTFVNIRIVAICAKGFE